MPGVAAPGVAPEASSLVGRFVEVAPGRSPKLVQTDGPAALAGVFRVGCVDQADPTQPAYLLEVGKEVVRSPASEYVLLPTLDEIRQSTQGPHRDPPLLVLRARLAVASGSTMEAFTALTEALGADPWNAYAYALRGSIHAQLGEHQRAYGDFSEAIRLDPGRPEYQRYRSRASAGRGHIRRAIADLSTAVVREGREDAAVLNDLVQLHMKARDFPRARAVAEKLAAVAPGEARYRLDRAFIDLSLGEYETAIALYDRVIVEPAAKDFRINAHLAKAFALTNQKPPDWQSAIKHYGTVIDETSGVTDDDRLQARLGRSFAYSRSDQKDNAIIDLNEGLELSPGNADALASRAGLYMATKEYVLAELDYADLLAILPREPDLLRAHADAASQAGKPALAIADYTVLIALDRKDATAYALRAIARRDAGQTALAELDFAEAIRIDPSNRVAVIGPTLGVSVASLPEITRGQLAIARLNLDSETVAKIEKNFNVSETDGAPWALRARGAVIAPSGAIVPDRPAPRPDERMRVMSGNRYLLKDLAPAF